MKKYLIFLVLIPGIIVALADPSREIEEASDKQKIDTLYKKTRRCKSTRYRNTHGSISQDCDVVYFHP